MTAGDLANCCIVGGHRPPLQRESPTSCTFCAKPVGRKNRMNPSDRRIIAALGSGGIDGEEREAAILTAFQRQQ